MPRQLRQLLHRLEEAERLAARLSPAAAADEASDIIHDFETTTRPGGFEGRRSMAAGPPTSHGRREAAVKDGSLASALTLGRASRTQPASRDGGLAPADKAVGMAKPTKPAARVSLVPPDELFLGLAVAGIVLLFEIGVVLLLVN